jgi:hypothetical protein
LRGEYYLQPGYSGSPVIDRENGCVLGVVTHQIGKGEKGLAISIQALVKIWQDMPASLITPPSPRQLSSNPASVIFVSPNSNVNNVVGSGQVNYQEAPNSNRESKINPSSNFQLTSIADSLKQRKCQHLRKQLDYALELLEDYQQQQRLTRDPKERQYAKIELERLQKEIEGYEKEMNELGC